MERAPSPTVRCGIAPCGETGTVLAQFLLTEHLYLTPSGPFTAAALAHAGTSRVAATVEAMASDILIEHGETRLARRVRQNRVKVALAIAALEGILVLAGAIPWWIVVLLALVALVGYAGWGRAHESADVRVATWTVAVSQLLVVLVPVLAGALVVLAALAVVVVAAVALAVLLLDRG